MDNLLRPDEPAGYLELIRIGAGSLVVGKAACPKYANAKARLTWKPPGSIFKGYELLDGFALGPVMAALDRIECDGIDEEAALESCPATPFIRGCCSSPRTLYGHTLGSGPLTVRGCGP